MSASAAEELRASPFLRRMIGSKGVCYFSPEEKPKYRYLLERIIDPQNIATAVVAGCNPSKASHERDDTTVSKGIGFAKRWGCGRLWMVNRGAYISTSPSGLLEVDDPVGPANFSVLKYALEHPTVKLRVAAWGDLPANTRAFEFALNGAWVLFRSHSLVCLGKTKAGNPKHPSRIAYATELEQYVFEGDL